MTGRAGSDTDGDTAERVVDEVAGAARLVGALVDGLAGPVQETHRGIASRVFRSIGPVAAPVRVAHDAVAGVAYGSVRVGARVAGGVAGAGLGLTARGRDRRPISATPRGALALAFADGLLGDWLDGRADDLVVRPAATVAPHGEPTDRVVVFLHGLAETPVAWSWWADTTPPYAVRLAEHGWTAVDVTYGTGRPVAESGAALAALLADLLDEWPEPVSELALVGHSMGGLVARAACAAGLDAAPSTRWVDRAHHVVTLGTPHAGSWLARAAHRGSAAAARLPETRGLATFLDLRSPGIRDLTRGQVDDLALADRMPHARHAFVTAGLAAPFHVLVGDGLVHRASAAAPASDHPNVVVRHHPGVGHLRLLNHPAVGDDLVGWLGPRRAEVATTSRPG